MIKKLLIFIIILIALLCLYFAYNYFTNPTSKAPASENAVFKGPTGQPSVKGPTALPPER